MKFSEIRKAAGFQTQQQFAEKLNIKREAVARWEIGESYPRPPLIPKIAQALKVSEGEVIQGVTESKG